MSYFLCGVVDVRGVHDEWGTACGRSAETLCSDCGTWLKIKNRHYTQVCIAERCATKPRITRKCQ